MIPFIVLFLYLGLIHNTTTHISDPNKIRLRQTWLGGLGLWLLLALRSWTCGNDLLITDDTTIIGYLPYFINLQSYSLSEILFNFEGYETGYNVLNWLIARLSNNPQIFLAVVAGIEISLIGYTLYKQSPNIVFSWIIFACLGLYIFSFSGLRQALGFSITFFAYNFINQKKPVVFILLVLLAYTFHTSAILFLPALFFRNRYLTNKKAQNLLFGTFCIAPFIMPIVQYGSVLVYGKEKYASDAGGAYGLFALFVCMFFFGIRYTLLQDENYKKRCQCVWMILLAILLQSTGFFSAGAMARVAYYYSIFFCLFLPLSLESATKEERRKWTLLISIMMVIFFMLVNGNGYLNVIPYRFFWEEHYNI